MMSSYLPLGLEFLSIFEKNKIVDWQAKHFWEKMPFDGEYNKNIFKAKMYRGLNILVQHKYLEKRKSLNNKNVYLYTGTSNIEYLINYQYNKEIQIQLDKQVFDIKSNIKIHEYKLNYVNELISEKILAERHVSKYKKELHKQLFELNLKLDVIHSIIDQYKL